MVTINCAYTEPINPTGATPTLTRQQVWKGLQRKVRRAQDFVPVITGTDVVEDKGDEVVRVAHFKAMHGQPEREVREVCRSFWPTKVSILGSLFFLCFILFWALGARGLRESRGFVFVKEGFGLMITLL